MVYLGFNILASSLLGDSFAFPSGDIVIAQADGFLSTEPQRWVKHQCQSAKAFETIRFHLYWVVPSRMGVSMSISSSRVTWRPLHIACYPKALYIDYRSCPIPILSQQWWFFVNMNSPMFSSFSMGCLSMSTRSSSL